MEDPEKRNVFENTPPEKNVDLIHHEITKLELISLDEENLFLKLKGLGFDLRRPITVREDPKTGHKTFTQHPR